jgi:hypothetical protein
MPLEPVALYRKAFGNTNLISPLITWAGEILLQSFETHV